MTELNTIEVEEVSGGIGFLAALAVVAICYFIGAEASCDNSGCEVKAEVNVTF
jgi:hypothetical protein